MRACSSACIRKKRIEIFRTLMPCVFFPLLHFLFDSDFAPPSLFMDTWPMPCSLLYSLLSLSCWCYYHVCALRRHRRFSALEEYTLSKELVYCRVLQHQHRAWITSLFRSMRYDREGERDRWIWMGPPCTRQYPLRWGRAVILLAIIWTSSENQSHPIIKHKCCSF